MDRLKTFATYILVIVLFYIFSNVMIFIGLNNTYNNIVLKGSIPEGITITSAKATSVNGEINGKFSEELNSKYIKFNFYTDADTLAGTYYITPSEFENNDFEFYFKLNYIESYSLELTDEKPDLENSNSFSSQEFGKYAILSAFIMLIFM